MLILIMISINLPPKKTNKEIEKFFKKKGLNLFVSESKGRQRSVNEMIVDVPYIPELNDLYRLYQLVVLNKRTTILEFGSGWSSLIFYLALNDLKKKYSKQVKNLRRNNPFELIILENEKKYLNISKNRIIKFSKILKLKQTPKTHYCFSDVEMTLFNNKIATQYKKLPLCNPDFIYLDGPDQFKVKNKINNFTTAHKDMMPMVSDILKFENFLTPGTIIVSDGRSANCEFLLNNFKRKWIHWHDKKFDQHIFYLNSPSLGKYNKSNKPNKSNQCQ